MQTEDKGSEPAPDDPSTTWWLAGGAVALLALAGWMAWDAWPALAAKSWPATEGTVRKLNVWEKTRLGAAQGPRQYQVEVEYDYGVNGKAYSGATFNTQNNHIDAEDVPAVQQQYQVGAKCTVRYSPLVPSNSILVADTSLTAWGKLVIGILALCGAAYLAVMAFR